MRPGSLKTPQQEVSYRKAARLYKQGVTIPLVLVGGSRSYGVAKKLVRDGKAEHFHEPPRIGEPGLVKRWREGDRRKAEWVSDHACFAPALNGKGI
jgi:2,4-dienoyl-CoA reductase-like NADH-dependent reductase (Old Yellow Enzyme family)